MGRLISPEPPHEQEPTPLVHPLESEDDNSIHSFSVVLSETNGGNTQSLLYVCQLSSSHAVPLEVCVSDYMFSKCLFILHRVDPPLETKELLQVSQRLCDAAGRKMSLRNI